MIGEYGRAIGYLLVIGGALCACRPLIRIIGVDNHETKLLFKLSDLFYYLVGFLMFWLGAVEVPHAQEVSDDLRAIIEQSMGNHAVNVALASNMDCTGLTISECRQLEAVRFYLDYTQLVWYPGSLGGPFIESAVAARENCLALWIPGIRENPCDSLSKWLPGAFYYSRWSQIILPEKRPRLVDHRPIDRLVAGLRKADQLRENYERTYKAESYANRRVTLYGEIVAVLCLLAFALRILRVLHELVVIRNKLQTKDFQVGNSL